MKIPYAIVTAGEQRFIVGGDGSLQVTGGSPVMNEMLTDAVARRSRELSPVDRSPVRRCAAEVARIVNGEITEVKGFEYPPATVF